MAADLNVRVSVAFLMSPIPTYFLYFNLCFISLCLPVYQCVAYSGSRSWSGIYVYINIYALRNGSSTHVMVGGILICTIFEYYSEFCDGTPK